MTKLQGTEGFLRRYRNPLELRIVEPRTTNQKYLAGELTTFTCSDSTIKIDYRANSNCLSFCNPLGAAWIYLKTPKQLKLNGSKIKLTIELLLGFEADVWVEYDSLDAAVNTIKDQPGAFKRTTTTKITKIGK